MSNLVVNWLKKLQRKNNAMHISFESLKTKWIIIVIYFSVKTLKALLCIFYFVCMSALLIRMVQS